MECYVRTVVQWICHEWSRRLRGENQEVRVWESGQGTAGSIEERHGDIGVMEEGIEQTSSVGIVLECDSRL